MEFIKQLIDIFLHLDKYMGEVINNYGVYTYAILGICVFCETGLVVTPFLPGDSLLFAAGTFAAIGSLNPWYICILLSVLAVLGDAVNYWVGHFIGPKVFQYKNSRIFKKEYLDRTHAFYEKYGAKTIIFARFVPIVRTFAPFIAGVGSMSYGKFFLYNVTGGVLWVVSCTMAGYFFGAIPIVKDNFTIVILGIVFVSILPAIIEVLRHKFGAAAKSKTAVGETDSPAA